MLISIETAQISLVYICNTLLTPYMVTIMDNYVIQFFKSIVGLLIYGKIIIMTILRSWLLNTIIDFQNNINLLVFY